MNRNPTVDELKKMDFAELIEEAESGDYKAMFLAATKMAIEGYVGKNAEPELNERYMRYMRTVADAGDVISMIQVGCSYAYGEDVEQDIELAFKYFTMAAENGESYGYECIGEMYFEGTGVAQDFEKAYEYLTKYKPKSLRTVYILGEMYRIGLHVKQDLKKANKYYEEIMYKLKDDEDDYFWRAAFRLGVLKHYGEGTKKDPERALELIEIARKYGRTEESPIKGESITKEAIDKEWALLSDELGKI